MKGWAQLFAGVGLWDILNLLLVAAILFVVVDTMSSLQAHPYNHSHTMLDDDRMRLYISSTTTVGMLTWPILWNIAAAKVAPATDDAPPPPTPAATAHARSARPFTHLLPFFQRPAEVALDMTRARRERLRRHHPTKSADLGARPGRFQVTIEFAPEAK